MQPDSNWNRFVEVHLLAGNVLDGLALLSKRGDAIYSYGRLIDLDKHQQLQFIEIFNATSEDQEAALCQKGFVLKTAQDTQEVKYTIFSKNLCSVYSTSQKNRCGLLVCNLPYGVLVTTYSFPHTSVEAIAVVDAACKLLRA